MKMLILVAAVFASVTALPVMAGTPCDDVKAMIAKKLDGKGVKNYSLEAVAAADVKGQKVIGSCEAGTKKIVYSRGVAKAEAKTAAKHEAKAEAKHEAKMEAKHEGKHEAKAAEAAPASAPAMKGPVMTRQGALK